jgi:hypothetical protein
MGRLWQVPVNTAQHGTQDAALMPALPDHRSPRGPDSGTQPGCHRWALLVVALDRTPLQPPRASQTDANLGVFTEVH